MKTIKLQSLNIKWEEFIIIIYHNTGLQFKYAVSNAIDTEAFKQRIADAIKEYEFEIEEIYENEDNFEESFWSKKSTWLKRSSDKPVEWLRFFRKNHITIHYTPKQKDMNKLRSISPPLYAWLLEETTITTNP